LLAPDIVQSLLSVRRFTTDNWFTHKLRAVGSFDRYKAR
jgi:hypothetical protein